MRRKDDPVSEFAISVGAVLARARTEAGLTTQQISDSTRIRRSIVEAIERDDHAVAGGAVYARGHIRSIATMLGLDAAPLLAQLDEEANPHAVISQPLEEPIEAPGAVQPVGQSLGDRMASMGVAVRTSRRSGPNWSAVMVSALALVVLIAGVQIVRSATRSSQTAGQVAATSVTSPSAPTSPAPSVPATATPTPTPTPTPSGSSADPNPSGSGLVAQAGVSVVVDASSRSWLSVTANQKTIYEGLLLKGQTRTFTDKNKVKITLGNAGGVTLTVNGHQLPAPGSQGQVVTVSFGPGDPTINQA
jgi:cytoskeleton protein RodZ